MWQTVAQSIFRMMPPFCSVFSSACLDPSAKRRHSFFATTQASRPLPKSATASMTISLGAARVINGLHHLKLNILQFCAKQLPQHILITHGAVAPPLQMDANQTQLSHSSPAATGPAKRKASQTSGQGIFLYCESTRAYVCSTCSSSSVLSRHCGHWLHNATSFAFLACTRQAFTSSVGTGGKAGGPTWRVRIWNSLDSCVIYFRRVAGPVVQLVWWRLMTR